MDLVKAALDAAVAADREAAAKRELQIAQRRIEQHRALEQEAAQWGLGPIPIGELCCYKNEPNLHSYYWWVHQINGHFVLVVRVTSNPSPFGTESRVLTNLELEKAGVTAPTDGLAVRSLADIGRRIRQHPSYKED